MTELKAGIEKLKQNKPVATNNGTQMGGDKTPVGERLSELDQFKKKYNIKENTSEI